MAAWWLNVESSFCINTKHDGVWNSVISGGDSGKRQRSETPSHTTAKKLPLHSAVIESTTSQRDGASPTDWRIFFFFLHLQRCVHSDVWWLVGSKNMLEENFILLPRLWRTLLHASRLEEWQKDSFYSEETGVWKITMLGGATQWLLVSDPILDVSLTEATLWSCTALSECVSTLAALVWPWIKKKKKKKKSWLKIAQGSADVHT